LRKKEIDGGGKYGKRGRSTVSYPLGKKQFTHKKNKIEEDQSGREKRSEAARIKVAYPSRKALCKVEEFLAGRCIQKVFFGKGKVADSTQHSVGPWRENDGSLPKISTRGEHNKRKREKKD